MKAKLFILSSFLFISLMSAQAQDTDVAQNMGRNSNINLNNHSRGVTIHNNMVIFKKGFGVEALNFEYENSNITAGQAPESPEMTVKQLGTELQLTFKSGRHKSPEVAKYFNSETGGCNHIIASAASCEPKELNFAIATKMFINNYEVIGTVYIAQGSNLIGNNWWVGSPGISTDDKGSYFEVTTTNGEEYIITTLDKNHEATNNIFHIKRKV